MPRRDRQPGRRAAPQPPHKRVLVFCGGARTEPAYFDGLLRTRTAPAAQVHVRYKGVAPHQLVSTAAEFAERQRGSFDEVWCVVDVDEFDIAAAVAEARRHKVNLAVSNPCFELWLLLHHTDCRSHCAGYEDVVKRLKKYVPAYDKTRLRFADHAEGVPDAVKRARDLEPSGADHQRNPSTSVWRLVQTIVEQT